MAVAKRKHERQMAQTPFFVSEFGDSWLILRRLLTHSHLQKLQPFQVLNLLRFATAPACASFSPPPLGSRTGVFSQHPVLQQAVSWNVVSSRSMLLNIPNNRRKIGWMLVYHWVCQNSSLQFLAKHSPCLAHRTISAFQFFCLWLA